MNKLLDELDAKHKASTQGEWVDRWHEVSDQSRDEQFAITCETASLGGVVVGLIEYDGQNIAVREHDAAWIAAIHNAWPEVVRMLRDNQRYISHADNDRDGMHEMLVKSEAERDQARAERDAAVALLKPWEAAPNCAWCDRDCLSHHTHDCPAAIVCGWAREERGDVSTLAKCEHCGTQYLYDPYAVANAWTHTAEKCRDGLRTQLAAMTARAEAAERVIAERNESSDETRAEVEAMLCEVPGDMLEGDGDEPVDAIKRLRLAWEDQREQATIERAEVERLRDFADAYRKYLDVPAQLKGESARWLRSQYDKLIQADAALNPPAAKGEAWKRGDVVIEAFDNGIGGEGVITSDGADANSSARVAWSDGSIYDLHISSIKRKPAAKGGSDGC